MGERAPSTRREQAELSARLRAEGRTWPEIAAVFCRRYRVNARLAMRLAHAMSQQDVADRWNRRWPDEPRTHKNISYWEQWPSSTGHQPSLQVLGRLAEIYECSVADLLSDCANHRQRDVAYKARGVQNLPAADESNGPAATVLRLAANRFLPDGSHPATDLGPLAARLKEADFNDLAECLTMWAHELNPDIDRRQLLFKVSSALAVAAAAPVFDRFDAEERARTVRALENPSRLDTSTINHAEQVVMHCRRQGDVLGPQATLQSVMAQRHLVSTLLDGRPSQSVLPRLLSVYAELTQLAGWLLFNLGDCRSAQHYYDDARTAAHDAHNVELVTYILCTMSHLATWQGKPRVGIDHAVAAQAWAGKAGSPQAQAYAGDVAARAYAADGQHDACREALGTERQALAQIQPGIPAANWWYFHDESFYWGTESECALMRRKPTHAMDAAARSLRLIDAANLHNYATTLSFQSEALIQQGDIPEACRIVGDVARLTVVNTSRRIDQRVIVLRGKLDRWNHHQAVVELDEALDFYRRRSAIGSGSTNKS